MTFLFELSTGKLQKCKKRSVSDAKSLQTVELPTGSSKYVRNWVLFRKHRILRYKIKPHGFWHFPWGSSDNLSLSLRLDSDLHKSMGAFSWEFYREKKHGAQSSECTACGESKNGPANLQGVRQIQGKLKGTQKIMQKSWSSHLKPSTESTGAIYWIWEFSGSSTLKWISRCRLGRKPWELYTKETISAKLDPWNAISPGALDIKSRVGTQRFISYWWNRPKPWELSLKTNLRGPKPWELSFKTDLPKPKPWELSLKTNLQRPTPWELSLKTNPRGPELGTNCSSINRCVNVNPSMHLSMINMLTHHSIDA